MLIPFSKPIFVVLPLSFMREKNYICIYCVLKVLNNFSILWHLPFSISSINCYTIIYMRVRSTHILYYEGNGLGPVHRSTGPDEILPRVQKLYKIGHVTASQRVQYSCALDPSLSLLWGYWINICLIEFPFLIVTLQEHELAKPSEVP